MRPYPISAVLVTRGDVELEPVLDSLPFYETVVWDNGAGEVVVRRDGVVWSRSPAADLAVYGRYAGIRYASHDVVYVQDDDAVLEPAALRQIAKAALAPSLLRMRPQPLVANVPERFRPHYPDSCLVGFGSAFRRDLPQRAFDRLDAYLAATGEAGPTPEEFNRTCDVFFTTLTDVRVLLDLPYRDREFASAPNRMWKQPYHVPERARMLDLARRVRDTRPV